VKYRLSLKVAIFVTIAGLLFGCKANPRPSIPLVIACSPTNDLYLTLTNSGVRLPRYDGGAEAVAEARPGDGLLILADGYPEQTTPLDAALLERAAAKRLRVFIEYPAWLPGLELGAPRRTQKERTVVASDAFSPNLERLRIVAIHDCHFVPVTAAEADLVVAKVAGFDTAVFGLPAKDVYPILFEHSLGVLVATTKLSQFITARYAPAEAWQTIWNHILSWLYPGQRIPDLTWTPSVRPSYTRTEVLPAGFELEAFRRGVRWFEKARLLIHPSWQHVMEEAGGCPDRVAPMPLADWPLGDGSLGMLEGFDAGIGWDGTQRARWWLRNDCMGEASLSFAWSASLDGNEFHRRIASNLNDFIYFQSPLAQGARADPKSPSFGLLGWNTTAKYYQDMDGFGVYYGDDNARSLLGTLAAAALLGSDRWNELALRCLLANFRTTGRLGFRQDRIDEAPLQKNGWRHYFDSEITSFAPHYQAYLWAALLWAYDRTGYRSFFDRTKKAIGLTMAAYPDEWRWTATMQIDRARMLLPLAWLVRVEDTAEHRGWLKRIAGDLLELQDDSGAIREVIDESGRGGLRPPASNEEYGTAETALIQENGDPACDLLYTTNFAFLGLHEAAAATGDRFYADAADKLAGFLARIQVRSEARPELDGAWFRAFDFKRWEYWASNADLGWGAWAVEAGWTMPWITATYAMRHKGTSLWDLTRSVEMKKYLPGLLRLMFAG
jgi:hypothetical protein